tara:strand:- start:1774 stop:1995 length:222 start_codon:yes stop_codon:yes gene_type:complete
MGIKEKTMNIVSVEDIIKYEEGNMNFEEVIVFFQTLVNTGQAWTLQGHYGRTAMSLIENGYVTRPEDNNVSKD